LHLTILTRFAISRLSPSSATLADHTKTFEGDVAFVFGPCVPEAEEVALNGSVRRETCYLVL